MTRRADLEVALIGAGQYHLVTLDQVLAAGVSQRSIERRVASGEWR